MEDFSHVSLQEVLEANGLLIAHQLSTDRPTEDFKSVVVTRPLRDDSYTALNIRPILRLGMADKES